LAVCIIAVEMHNQGNPGLGACLHHRDAHRAILCQQGFRLETLQRPDKTGPDPVFPGQSPETALDRPAEVSPEGKGWDDRTAIANVCWRCAAVENGDVCW